MFEYFENLTDMRQAGKVKHNLLEIVVMTICAVIAGCEAWEDIADYYRVKKNWFKESLHIKLENGIDLAKARLYLDKGKNTVLQDKRYKTVQIYFDVDPA